MDFSLKNTDSYKLIDCGDGEKLEDFAGVILRRPDPQSIWPKSFPLLWENYDLYFKKTTKGFKWVFKKDIKEWKIIFENLNLILKINNFKHTGLFPEQAILWRKMGDLIDQSKKINPNKQIKVLNLFSYTGASALYLAKKGADVLCVDSSKQAILWANQNKSINSFSGSVRFLLDDALKFVEKESKRGNVYDAILLDPPPYGKTSSGKKWILEDDLLKLLISCKKILSKNKIFLLLSGYGTNYSFLTYQNLLQKVFEEKKNISSGELSIKQQEEEAYLSSGIFSIVSF